jgi:hypothetical protein
LYHRAPSLALNGQGANIAAGACADTPLAGYHGAVEVEMSEQPPTQPAAEEQPETIEILAHVFQDWKQDHPDGTWRDFWAAVGKGEVKMPG